VALRFFFLLTPGPMNESSAAEHKKTRQCWRVGIGLFKLL